MPRRSQPLLNNKFAHDILAELETYATDKQFYPVQNALYGHMRRKDYKVTIGEFNYWFDRLVRENYIQVDPDTRSVRCVRLMIVERET